MNPPDTVGHRPRVLMLTTFDLDDYVYESLRAGASGFLLKDATAGDLVAAVRIVAAGEALLAPTVTRRLIEEFALLVWTGLTASSAKAATNTVVSLTFDDGQASQYATLPMLSAHGMAGTYYVNSALLGSDSYYMTWSQVHDLANAGSEIGGHTLHHVDLTKVGTATAQTEVCDDRTNLLSNGFSPVASFAYPYAASNATTEQIVQGCGYASARTVGNINSITACRSCPYAETVPPQDPYYLRTPAPAVSGTTLSDLQTYVTNAETHGGGWVVLVFHGICDNNCAGSNSLSPSVFTAFLDWLQPLGANGTEVRTVGQVMGAQPPGPDRTPPTTTIACNGAPCSAWYNSPVTVSLSATDIGGSGVNQTLYTTDGSDPKTSGIAYTGPFTVATTTTVRFYSTDNANPANVEQTRSQTIQIDTVAPTGVAMTSPQSGSYRRGTLALAATASDAGSGVTSVAFYDGAGLLGTDTSAPYEFAWNTRKAPIGQHTLTAVASDAAGNSTTSPPVTVTITQH